MLNGPPFKPWMSKRNQMTTSAYQSSGVELTTIKYDPKILLIKGMEISKIVTHCKPRAKDNIYFNALFYTLTLK